MAIALAGTVTTVCFAFAAMFLYGQLLHVNYRERIVYLVAASVGLYFGLSGAGLVGAFTRTVLHSARVTVNGASVEHAVHAC